MSIKAAFEQSKLPSLQDQFSLLNFLEQCNFWQLVQHVILAIFKDMNILFITNALPGKNIIYFLLSYICCRKYTSNTMGLPQSIRFLLMHSLDLRENKQKNSVALNFKKNINFYVNILINMSCKCSRLYRRKLFFSKCKKKTKYLQAKKSM